MTGSDVGVFAAFGALMGLMFIICIVMYVLFSLGLYTLAGRRNIENPWLAWIPVVQFYTMGEVIGPVKIADYNIDKPGLSAAGYGGMHGTVSDTCTWHNIYVSYSCIKFRCFLLFIQTLYHRQHTYALYHLKFGDLWISRGYFRVYDPQ